MWWQKFLNFQELKEGNAIEVVEGTQDSFSSNLVILDEEDDDIVTYDDYKKELEDVFIIQTLVFTDGEIDKVEELLFIKNPDISFDNYVFSNNPIVYNDVSVDTLMIKDLYLKDYTYAIVFTYAKKYNSKGKFYWYDDLKGNVQIYVQDINNKQAINNARLVLKEFINRYKIKYCQIPDKVYFDSFLASNYCKNIYSLKKKHINRNYFN